MTKTQHKAAVNKLLEKFYQLKDELENIQCDLQEDADNIEPYDDKDDLTPQQEERQEWLSDSADTVQNAIDELDEVISSLEEITY